MEDRFPSGNVLTSLPKRWRLAELEVVQRELAEEAVAEETARVNVEELAVRCLRWRHQRPTAKLYVCAVVEF